ncbi:DedA family protein [Micromonospora sp. RHAY321]|uniref:DedA family protein n=1 Tax=Micromonospora sp. RHAY321 TaxID=2944807 RepID=UPI00207C7DD6|nr:DedA family protein [Micromonospora sp. RHAY321]MCO1593683.1 DedA family protein [Micromonospora sp. RHAY321]
MTRLINWLLALQGVGAYLLVGLLVFAEDALFIGFLLPGETAAILGGVAASRGHVALPVMIAVVVGAAIIGDSAGYEVGRHLGPRLLRTRPLRRREQRIDAARDLLARRGGAAVFLGRFVAFLRAVMPALAGTAHMPYRTFLAFNAAGALVWGTGTVVLGYLAGNSYSTVEKTFGRAAALIVLAVAVTAVIAWRIRHHTTQRHTFSSPAEPGGRARDTD